MNCRLQKVKFFLCGLPPQGSVNGPITADRRKTGYLVKKGGGKTRNLEEALSQDLNVVLAEDIFYNGGQYRAFFPTGKFFMEGMICDLLDEKETLNFLERHPLPRKKIPAEMRERIYRMFGGRCAYCGQPIELSEMQVDHVMPYVYGGPDEEDNFLPACEVCNRVKSSSTIEGFRSDVRHCGEIHRKRKIQIMADSDKIAIAYGIDTEDHEIVFFFEKEGKQ